MQLWRRRRRRERRTRRRRSRSRSSSSSRGGGGGVCVAGRRAIVLERAVHAIEALLVLHLFNPTLHLHPLHLKPLHHALKPASRLTRLFRQRRTYGGGG